ncbi:Putative ribosomal RNA methyltransferase CG11447 [Camponotus floridanus]|uniref:rRNA methyltransferase 2, mitochondrial n=1 Tax=Camponotus floridanus TaxID=104421 RepID=E2ANP9_CAMFO|nr:rRNA methyltransferase 2, mitochondrial [Camponotus floridanus]EFN64935.1 Putative ribosomal RNA methyltransferase CG11447 [Camponotus floridanus]
MNCFCKIVSQTRSVYTNCMLLKETPRNLKGKKHSSQLWLMRQIRDPYVEKAKQENYRCRSAFKLLQINEKYKIFCPGLTVIDCGAAPGSWTQVATNLTNSHAKSQGPIGKVYAIDKLPFFPVEGATVLGNMDFTITKTQETLLALLQGKKADVVLSDMAPNASGIRAIDHDNIILLAYAALKFALQITKIHGTLVIKVWDGGKSQELEQNLLRFYNNVKIVKPDATRDESTEKFFLARGFKGLKTS